MYPYMYRGTEEVPVVWVWSVLRGELNFAASVCET